ncbi:tRNA 2-thiouridine(34) synthase MnmA [Caloramator sp. E03]|uniref:tRNA 2-thiouridine(34) synthase MnmA n=1 Tax=Caloramator sp. E03 TaxID=2576307 RepID=UPI0011108411|nr:tRNA 2-thiouridine(34) synthase MnmA [Caloramator sp. E03]QCX32742.1 tRNA 2-thiouridine(34) synthase MnmA [Caloramator sp. E03]
MKEKVVVGMSGGVDSSVTAYLLQKSGYDVIGITMQVWPYNKEYEEREGGCCSLSAVNDARRVADMLNIPFYVMNFKEVFEKKVIQYFVDEYIAGRTPNPCIACNKHIKFDEFLRKAHGIGAKYIATGHYAKIVKDENTNRYLLLRSKDALKDQTYVLYNMTQYQLQHTLMPLGDYTKDKVREIAKEIGLSVASKPDSEEICFIPDNDYGKFIKERVPEKIHPGNFVDREGNILGRHKGIANYTIGQRKGLGIALGRPAYVVDIIPERNEVVLGEEKEVFNSRLYAKDVNLIPFDNLKKEMKVTAKIRYSAKETPATIYPYKEGIVVEFDTPVRAITKGQSVVFYNDDIVVGGGVIDDIL